MKKLIMCQIVWLSISSLCIGQINLEFYAEQMRNNFEKYNSTFASGSSPSDSIEVLIQDSILVYYEEELNFGKKIVYINNEDNYCTWYFENTFVPNPANWLGLESTGSKWRIFSEEAGKENQVLNETEYNGNAFTDGTPLTSHDYTYNNDGLISLDIKKIYVNEEWVNNTKMNYSYDGPIFGTANLTEVWDEALQQWRYQTLTSYSETLAGDYLPSQVVNFDLATTDITGGFKYDYEFIGTTSLISQITLSADTVSNSLNLENLFPFLRVNYAYENGQEVQTILYAIEDEEWKEVTLSEKQYIDDQYLEFEQQYNYVDNEWEIRKRFHHFYTEFTKAVDHTIPTFEVVEYGIHVIGANPIVDNTTFRIEGMKGNDPISFNLCDIKGRMIYQETIASDKDVSLPSLASGMYILHLSMGNEVIYSDKLVKQ